jgi:hypothetical protein
VGQTVGCALEGGTHGSRIDAESLSSPVGHLLSLELLRALSSLKYWPVPIRVVPKGLKRGDDLGVRARERAPLQQSPPPPSQPPGSMARSVLGTLARSGVDGGDLPDALAAAATAPPPIAAAAEGVTSCASASASVVGCFPCNAFALRDDRMRRFVARGHHRLLAARALAATAAFVAARVDGRASSWYACTLCAWHAHGHGQTDSMV